MSGTTFYNIWQLWALNVRILILSSFLLLHVSVPEGLEDVSKYPDLIAHLIDRGWGEQDIKKLLGENLLRVFRAVEKVSINKKLLGKPTAGI